MREYHTFIDRNYLIYKAVLSEKIEIEELERLHRNSLNASALNGQVMFASILNMKKKFFLIFLNLSTHRVLVEKKYYWMQNFKKKRKYKI